MDKPISGDKYVRTLSHYLRSNQRRLLPPTPLPPVPPLPTTQTTTSAAAIAANARTFVTPGDPMAAAYADMVESLWNVTTAVVNSITPTSLNPYSGEDPVQTRERELYAGAWDGTGAVLPEASPRDRHLPFPQSLMRSPTLPLDLYYLLYLLERFEQVGIDLEGWSGTSTSNTVGDSKNPHLTTATGGGLPNSTSYSSFPPPATGTGGGPASNRPQSIRSFSSTALSTLTLITGWKQWSSAASNSPTNFTITDDIRFIHKFMQQVPSLRLLAKIPPGDHVQGKGRIEGYNADAILTLFNHGLPIDNNSMEDDVTVKPALLLLPLPAAFPALTHLELHRIPPDCVEGWETLMTRLQSLVVIQGKIDDVHDVIVTAVVNSERRRRQRQVKELDRVTQIKQEQQEALKDAALTSATLQMELTHGDDNAHKSEEQQEDSATVATAMEVEEEDDEALILASLKMWPVLSTLSLSDNSLPALAHNDTFFYTQAVTSLDLSHNLLLSPPTGLIHLHNMRQLNLSYNMISGTIYQTLGNIASLDLRNNRLESLSGLERLWNLEKVDVRENHLDDAAEVGRLAALPGIREIWSDRNPFCFIQPKYRIEILAVFKANGHNLLLDGTFASFNEKRALANMSPTTFYTTMANVANIPAASAPVATFAKDVSPHHLHHPQPHRPHHEHTRSQSSAEDAAIAATVKSTPGNNAQSPVNKLVKRKLMKSNKRAKRVVDLDGDDYDRALEGDTDGKAMEVVLSEDEEMTGPSVKFSSSVLGSPAMIGKKKKKKTTRSSDVAPEVVGSPSSDGNGAGIGNGNIKSPGTGGTLSTEAGQQEEPVVKVRRRVPKKRNLIPPNVSFAAVATAAGGHGSTETESTENDDPSIDHSLCRDNHHVHRLVHLEQSMATIQLERATSPTNGASSSPSAHARQPSRGILKRAGTMGADMGRPISRVISPSPQPGVDIVRPSSPIGSFSSDDGGADGYRRRIQAMRNEAGHNWLMVLAELNATETTGSLSIFDIHVLVELIAQGLTSNDIWNCMRTSKSWLIAFQPHLWRRVKLPRYGLDLTHDQVSVLRKNSQWIRVFIAPWQDVPFMNQDLIRNLRVLQCLYTGRKYTYSPAEQHLLRLNQAEQEKAGTMHSDEKEQGEQGEQEELENEKKELRRGDLDDDSTKTTAAQLQPSRKTFSSQQLLPLKSVLELISMNPRLRVLFAAWSDDPRQYLKSNLDGMRNHRSLQTIELSCPNLQQFNPVWSKTKSENQQIIQTTREFCPKLISISVEFYCLVQIEVLLELVRAYAGQLKVLRLHLTPDIHRHVLPVLLGLDVSNIVSSESRKDDPCTDTVVSSPPRLSPLQPSSSPPSMFSSAATLTHVRLVEVELMNEHGPQSIPTMFLKHCPGLKEFKVNSSSSMIGLQDLVDTPWISPDLESLELTISEWGDFVVLPLRSIRDRAVYSSDCYYAVREEILGDIKSSHQKKPDNKNEVRGKDSGEVEYDQAWEKAWDRARREDEELRTLAKNVVKLYWKLKALPHLKDVVLHWATSRPKLRLALGVFYVTQEDSRVGVKELEWLRMD
ncbi:hypothetical protein BGZ83_012037 [Gryganskiella cystojenkinii]|nr:hypothetical protein BGZ83_012037 [Gryganskiella cystojenkinii]